MPTNDLINQDSLIDENTTDKEENTPFREIDNYGQKIHPTVAPERNIGMDVKNEFFDNILDAATVSKLDLTTLESFSQISQNRNLVYNVLDTMCEDSTISAVVETYAEDATEMNDEGRIVWAESEDSEVKKYITYLLDSLNVDKHIYKWMHSLIKYGDCYLRLYKISDYEAPIFYDEDVKAIKDKREQENKNKKQDLKESVNIIYYDENDKFAHYVEMVPNPAEIFELTRYGKSYAYIDAPSIVMSTRQADPLYNKTYTYTFQDKDVDIYDATSFVHAALLDNTSRTPEKVNIFIDNEKRHYTDIDKLKEKKEYQQDSNEDIGQMYSGESVSFNVNRGQSILYNVFKIWRNLTLLENSLLLNRLTKSSIVRVINVEVGDMPKESVGPHLLGIKQMIEQKSAINQGESLAEYTNPGPIENSIYVPTHNGIGTLSASEIGGEVNPGTLTDIDYFQNKLFGALKVPKQYFANTDDGAGFNGGQSLSLISSRYAKTVMRLQNTMLQALTDACNIFLLDKGLDQYINKFQLHMVRPTTQEEKDRQENKISEIGVVRDLMDLFGDIENTSARLEILKILIAAVTDNSDIARILDEQIKTMLEQESMGEDTSSDDGMDMFGGGDFGGGFHEPSGAEGDLGDAGFEADEGQLGAEEPESGVEETNGELPSPDSLGLDFSNNNMEI